MNFGLPAAKLRHKLQVWDCQSSHMLVCGTYKIRSDMQKEEVLQDLYTFLV